MATTAPFIKHIPREEMSPLSFAQQKLLLLCQLRPGNAAYHIPAAVRLIGQLDMAVLEQSLNEIARRHGALRTTFATVGGQPMQVIAPPRPMPLSVLDPSALPKVGREAGIQRLMAEEAQRPFDLARGPLVRATLLQLGDKEHVFFLTLHHIVADDWSVGVFWQELAALYDAFSTAEPSPLPELTVQYADFAAWQWQWLQGEELQAQLSYWKQQLAGAPPVLELPADRLRPATRTFQGASLLFNLPQPLTKAMQALSGKDENTLFITLLAAFKVLLYRYTRQDDIVIGTPVSNRNWAEIKGLIGFFANTLLLRTDLSGNPTLRELLGRVREVTLEAYAHQALPFERLVDELQPERDTSYNPLFQVAFAFQNAPIPSLELAELSLSPLQVDSGTAKFDLTLAFTETPQGLQGRFEYNTDLFEATTIDRMAGHLQTLLKGIVTDPNQRLTDVPILTKAERKQLLEQWSHTGGDYAQDLSVNDLFQQQVHKTPTKVSVVGDRRELTFQQLNEQANQLVHLLRRLSQ